MAPQQLFDAFSHQVSHGPTRAGGQVLQLRGLVLGQLNLCSYHWVAFMMSFYTIMLS